MTLLPVLQILAVVSGAPTTGAPASFQAALDEAVELFDSFEDERAAMKFHALLANKLPGQIASKAHLYLGLIALNAFEPDDAKAEFRRALEANPAADLPPQASPKARLAFGEVRRDLSAEVEGTAPGPRRARNAVQAAVPSRPEPAAAAAAPTAQREQEPPGHSHTAAYVIGAATVVLAALAIYGGVEVLDYNSAVSAGNSYAGTGTNPPNSWSGLSSAKSSASFWAVGWPVAAGLAAAGVVGAVLTW